MCYEKTLKIFILLFSAIPYFPLVAQQVANTLYKGKINKGAVTFYLKQESNPCGGGIANLYQGNHQYVNGKNWIELDNLSNQKDDILYNRVWL
ncbi:MULTISPECIES: hypothetical protein [unclassified Sphingobacterium]|uniref:hypothetical protein n=1 Tax=unclassified Sphingobacterium TaxID=2609468 RepID=UPI00104D6470|nr:MULTISPECIES: hypothetical protein [unclassified Sphingobacterium]MCS3552666.1 hypothetical protein [Sphingobacterium sp. JUb21]TCR10574.1 hypothetical protein EDF66_101388 [Sphingobacterium sp. JUb20]